MFKVKYVDSIMMLVRLDLNLIVSLFQHKCEVSETVSTTTLASAHFAALSETPWQAPSLSQIVSWVRLRALLNTHLQFYVSSKGHGP